MNLISKETVRPHVPRSAGFGRFCHGFADRENEPGSGLNTSFAGFAGFGRHMRSENQRWKTRKEGGRDVYFVFFY
jgi:hypothetical protein